MRGGFLRAVKHNEHQRQLSPPAVACTLDTLLLAPSSGMGEA